MRRVMAFAALLAAAFLLSTGAVLAQEQAREIAPDEASAAALVPQVPCPAPVNLALKP